MLFIIFFFKQKTAYEMRISDWSSDVCSSDLMKINVFLLVFVLVACNAGTRDFEWHADIAQITGKDLDKWLRQAPFTNELSQQEENKIVFTNSAQVFPFMRRYNNAVGELEYSPESPANPIYQQETVLYQYTDWGDLFINATLLYDAQEVFLDPTYI